MDYILYQCCYIAFQNATERGSIKHGSWSEATVDILAKIMPLTYAFGVRFCCHILRTVGPHKQCGYVLCSSFLFLFFNVWSLWLLLASIGWDSFHP